jgi:protein-disulfide isomerase
MKQKTLFIIAVACLLLAFIGGVLLYATDKANQSPQLPDAQRAALIRMHSPVEGSADAPVVIVEFFDPACGTCRAFYPLVKNIMKTHPGRIRLVLRYAPFHNGSDKVVALLEAARKQGKFWPALEAVLGAQDAWAPNHMPNVELVWPHLQGLGLDLDKVRADLTAPEIANVIAQDLADARTLNVTQTPEYFVNGKPLPSFGFEQLQTLVDDELNATRKR